MRNIWKGRNVKVGETILRLLLAGSCVLTLTAAEWRQEVVDATATGRFTSLRIDKNGNGHLGYLDDSQNLLKYGFWDHKLLKWFTATIDKSRGYCSLVLDSKQHPHISYLAYGDGQIKYAHWTGTAWEKQTIGIKAKDISFYTSITLDSEEKPRISYYEYWGAGEDYLLHLRNVAWNGKYWQVSTIDATPGSGKFNSIATDSTGSPHIAYANVKAENASLRYARWNGRAWDIEVLEGADSPYYVYSVAIVLDAENSPHIAYTDVTRRQVKYATRRDGRWQIQVVDSLVDVAYPDRNGIAVDAQGRPYLSYYDVGTGVLKVAYRRNQKWVAEIVDQNFSGFTSSLQISGDAIWVTYADEGAGVLKCARGSLEQVNPPSTVSQQKSVPLSNWGPEK